MIYVIGGLIVVIIGLIIKNRMDHDYYLNDIELKEKSNHELQRKLDWHNSNVEKMLESHKQSMPWLGGMIADFLTIDIEKEARKLDWSSAAKNVEKVAKIRDIRETAKKQISEAKVAVYQMEYLKNLYPALEDVLDTSFEELDFKTEEIPHSDPISEFISKLEWERYTEAERNQLALDRYIESRKKSKWQIGRDYELSVAYELQCKGYAVITYGAQKKLEDLGRDLIASKDGLTYIIQCKYWGKEKLIHEKHIYQLFGTMVSYCIENSVTRDKVRALFVTNIGLSETARIAARLLGVQVAENHPAVEFPRIKCNIGRDEYGITTHIYHLPMDDQYDSVVISKKGECYAFTVKEAEDKGFRRAYKWHGL